MDAVIDKIIFGLELDISQLQSKQAFHGETPCTRFKLNLRQKILNLYLSRAASEVVSGFSDDERVVYNAFEQLYVNDSEFRAGVKGIKHPIEIPTDLYTKLLDRSLDKYQYPKPI